MSSIEERKYPSGRVVWRVKLRKRGVKSFCLSFESLEKASQWLKENEKEYYKNPDKYLHWRERTNHTMISELKKIDNGLIKPRISQNINIY